MATSMWYCIAVMLLALVRGESYENDSKSFYEKPESSSPTPLSSPSLRQQEEAKEVVLYLTSDQAQALQAAGAVVKLLPEFENTLSQQQYQQGIEEQTDLIYQPITTDDNKNNQQKNNYRESNEQEIKEDVSPSREQITEKPFSKYKYILKPRPQEYSSLYTTKKLNNDQTYSTEYVRYLPSYEFETLKMEPYNTQPVSGYRFEGDKFSGKPQTYTETDTPELRQPEDIQNSEEFRKIFDLTRSYTIDSRQKSEDKPLQKSSIIKDKGPVTFEGKPLEPAKVWEPTSVGEYSNIWKANKETEQYKTNLGIGTPSEISIKPGLKIEEKPSLIAPTQATIQRQFSSLLAPLIQHKKIVETISEQKEDLINSERVIQSKLQQIKESGIHNQQKYVAELEKLNKNLGKQNALAQKIALEVASKKPQLSAKPEFIINRRRPIQLERYISDAKPVQGLSQLYEPVELRLPQSSDDFRPASISLLQAAKTKEPLEFRVQKPISVPVIRDYSIKPDKLYTLRKVPPTEYKQEIPSSLSIIRHLWDH